MFRTNQTAFIPALSVSFPTVAVDVNGVAVDGTSPLNQTNLSVLDQAITNWPPGAALGLRGARAASPPTRPGPLNLQTSGTNLLLNWPGVAGQTYQLEYKDDLTAPTWTPLGGAVTGTGGQLAFTNNFGTSSQRFFRLRLVN